MQRLANPRVGAGHGYRDPGPVANVTPSLGERLERDRVGTVEHARQVADHTTGPVGQSQLNPLVQLLHDVTEPAGSLNNHDLTHGVFPGPHLPTHGRTAGQLCWELGRDLRHGPGREKDHIGVGACRKVLGKASLLRYGELDSVAANRGTRATEGWRSTRKGQPHQGPGDAASETIHPRHSKTYSSGPVSYTHLRAHETDSY